MRAGNLGVPTTSEWLNDVLTAGSRVGIDPVSNTLLLKWLHHISYSFLAQCNPLFQVLILTTHLVFSFFILKFRSQSSFALTIMESMLNFIFSLFMGLFQKLGYYT